MQIKEEGSQKTIKSSQKTFKGSEKNIKSSEKTFLSKEKNLKSKEKILNLIHQNPSITTKELAEMIGLSIAGIEKNLRQMKENNQIRRVGPDKVVIGKLLKNKTVKST